MRLLNTRWKRWTTGAILSAALLMGGYYVARHYAWPAYKARRIAGMNHDAKAFLDQGDLANALLTARKSLQSSTENPDAWRVAAAAAKARGSTDALSYQDNLCKVEPTKENYYELIRLALRFNAPTLALSAVRAVAVEAHGDPVFYRLGVQVFLRLGKPVAARYYLLSLTQLQPGDAAAQLDLAELDLAADPEHKHPELRTRVRALLGQPELRHRVLALLLRDNLAGKITEGTDELRHQLAGMADLGVFDRLLLLEAAQQLGDPAAPAQLAQLQAEVAGRPAEVARMIDFLVHTGMSARVPAWVASLPEVSRHDEEVQARVAEILRAQSAWPALISYLSGPRWLRREYLRQTFLAAGYRAQGRSTEFAQAWNLALIEAGGDLGKTLDLLGRLGPWNWVNERYALVWKLFQLVPANSEVQTALAVWERNQGDTANLNRLFARVVQVDAADRTAKNNLAYTDLLLDANLVRAAMLTAELVQAEPHNPYFVTTRALALYKQDHPAEALALLDTLTAAERAEPVRMLFRAVFLTRLGRVAPAAELMNGVVLTGLLPEEKRLADGTRLEIARLDRLQGNRTRLLAFRQNEEQQTGRTGWLVLVSAATRAAAPTDLQLADSLYAAGDWPGLRELLRSTQWRDEDYLRSALLAFVARQEGSAGSSHDAWVQAMAAADRNPARVQNLRALAAHWAWSAERLETTNLVFERNPTDRLLLDQLLQDYRALRRTSDLVRVLGLYVANVADTTDEAVAHAYYSLLLDTNIARAHVVARNAFEANPADTMRRMVYAFSLYKQNRAAEAAPLLAKITAGAASGVVPVALLSATIQTQLGDTRQARENLARFDAAAALPEEKNLADKLNRLLSSADSVPKSPST